jgi:hypothetical protein
MTKFVVSLFFAGLLLAACSGRNIDRSVGLGPQGGPGYKPELPPAGYPPPAQGEDWFVAPDNVDRTSAPWNFLMIVYRKATTDRFHFRADLVHHQIVDENDHSIGGSVECLDSSVGSTPGDCKSLHALVPAFWEVSSGQSLKEDSLGFTAKVQTNCRLLGRFEWEKKPVLWATGNDLVVTSDQQSIGSAHVATAANTLEFKTDDRLVDISANTNLIYLKIDNQKPWGSVSIKFPTRTSEGIFVSYLGPSDFILSSRTIKPGHYEGELTFQKLPEYKFVDAHVEIICDSPL